MSPVIAGKGASTGRNCRQRENRTNALYRLSQALSDAQNSQAVARIAVQHIHDDFAAAAVLLFPDANNQLHYPAPNRSVNPCAALIWLPHNEHLNSVPLNANTI